MSTEASSTNSPPPIQLTDTEQVLKRLLLDVANHIDNAQESTPVNTLVKLPQELASQNLVLRFTGGWVRDKLLGVGSHDIDIAINKMTGYQFGLRLKEYLEIPGNPEKYDLEGVATTEAQSAKAGTSSKSKVVGGLHKIEANPEKSKNLETATTRIFGLDIDLVNLRKETYNEQSRNPQVEFGTPEEDALRRDATVNAMFYNLHTNQTEDLTGKGHSDMAAHIIRTPLEPAQTFTDDPLRVLRLIRFASRLGYRIDPAAEAGMERQDITDAFRAKITRERVGVEFEKMLRGPDPYTALETIERLGLYSTILEDPAQSVKEITKPDLDGWRLVLDTTKAIVSGKDSSGSVYVRDEEERYLAWIMASMVPYRDAPQPTAEPGRKSPNPMATNIAREGIKATNKVAEVITSAIRNREDISLRVKQLAEWDEQRSRKRSPGTEDPSARDVLGMAIRRWGSTWRTQFLYALLTEVADDSGTRNVGAYHDFIAYVQKLDVLDAYAFKPLIDGKALTKALSASPGTWMKDALDVVMAWQLRNPGTTDTEAAVEEVRNTGLHGELKADLMDHFLRLTIRPLFAKNLHPEVTAQGRKNNMNALRKPSSLEASDDVQKPWKGTDVPCLSLLSWVVKNSDAALAEKHWHLLIPPILALLDDHETAYKVMGCNMLATVLRTTPSKLLARTGLHKVFEEALTPCLGYLPTLTPEKDAVALLSQAYPALLVLCNVSYPESEAHTQASVATNRIAFLDNILRKGVLAGYAHCPENIAIVEVLLNNTSHIIEALGIDSVKHHKYILPMLSDILSNPFGPSSPSLLLAASKTLQVVICNGWPRMAANRGEVLKSLTIAWLNLLDAEEENVSSTEVQKELRKGFEMLRDATEDRATLEEDCKSLVAADPRLAGLLSLDR